MTQMQWVVQISLNDVVFVLHGPFKEVTAARAYAKAYADLNPQVGTLVHGLHAPSPGLLPPR